MQHRIAEAGVFGEEEFEFAESGAVARP